MHQELITQVSLVASVCNWDQNRTNWNCRGLAVSCEILLDDDFAAHSAAADFFESSHILPCLFSMVYNILASLSDLPNSLNL